MRAQLAWAKGSTFFYQINAEVACQLSELEGRTSLVLKRIPLFIWTFTPEGFGAKLTFAKASGIVTGDAPVSYWPIFPLSSVTVPEVFASATLETRRKLSRVNFRKGVWDRYWGRAGQRLANFSTTPSHRPRIL